MPTSNKKILKKLLVTFQGIKILVTFVDLIVACFGCSVHVHLSFKVVKKTVSVRT